MSAPWLCKRVLAHAVLAPDAPAVDAEGARLTYVQLADRILRLGQALVADGLKPGERVLVALHSCPALVVAHLGVQAAGGCVVLANPELGDGALRAIASQARCRVAVVGARDATTLASNVERLWVVPEPGHVPGEPPVPSWSWLLEDGRVHPIANGPRLEALRTSAGAHAPALVLFTSGTTSAPRGVMLSHRNIEANTRSIAEYLALSASDRALLVLPPSYSYGLSVLQTHLFVGGSVYLERRAAYPQRVLESLVRERCTGFAGVPATFELMRRTLRGPPPRAPTLRYLTQAGGAMSQETTRWVRKSFAPAQLFAMYGQTEATARLSYLPPARAADKTGSIGIPIPGVELQVVGLRGEVLPPGEVGELVARGENIALGYLEAPEETRATFRDGWLRTGDLALRDRDGFFYLVGRAKEMLKIGGHRVSPLEIENVLSKHAQVVEAAVAGAPDPLCGERPVAFVVARPGAPLSIEALQRHCRAALPAFKVPGEVVLVDALPRNSAGKVLRRELLALLSQPSPGGAPWPNSRRTC